MLCFSLSTDISFAFWEKEGGGFRSLNIEEVWKAFLGWFSLDLWLL